MKLDLNNELSEYIKLLRFRHKKNQEDMANYLGISRNTYSIWENKPIKLSLDDLVKIGIALEEDILIFFNEYVAKCNPNRQEKED